MRDTGCGMQTKEPKMSECKNFEKNKTMCNCSYEPCSRKYTCCECLHYHRRMGELPACYFSEAGERSYDRSVENYMRGR